MIAQDVTMTWRVPETVMDWKEQGIWTQVDP